MKLFYSPGACSLASHIVLREAGLPFTLEKVDLVRHVTESGTDYYGFNPKGQVPFLLLGDGNSLSEGPVIAQFIADKAGAEALLPPVGSLARYQVQEWQNYITAELHKSFSPLFNPRFDAAAKALHAELLGEKYAWVNRELAGRAYLTGDQFTVADAYLFTVTRWARLVDFDLSGLDNVHAFLARVARRPAVQAAMRAEGLIV